MRCARKEEGAPHPARRGKNAEAFLKSDDTLILMDEGRIEENPVSNKIRRIRTGGQSGVDRAALDVARELNIEICGWCPRASECLNAYDVTRTLLIAVLSKII